MQALNGKIRPFPACGAGHKAFPSPENAAAVDHKSEPLRADSARLAWPKTVVRLCIGRQGTSPLMNSIIAAWFLQRLPIKPDGQRSETT